MDSPGMTVNPKDSAAPVYPGTSVLINYAGITDGDELGAFEAAHVSIRSTALPCWEFGPRHLQALHRHLFQDVYSWAGGYRTCSITRGQSLFAMPAYIEANVNSIVAKLTPEILHSPSQTSLAARLGYVVAELNAVHPFREGNGRTIRAYATQAAYVAGFWIDWSSVAVEDWLQASRKSFREADSEPMRHLLAQILCTPPVSQP